MKTKKVLNQAVADLSVFASKIHQAHWYMRGPQFLNMHPKMDEYMDEINAHLDQIAERLIIIGGSPYSTLPEFSDNSKLKEKEGDFKVSMEDHVKMLIEGYTHLDELYQQGIDAAGEDGDAVTEDLFTSLKEPVQKNIWMLNAVLGKAPGIK